MRQWLWIWAGLPLLAAAQARLELSSGLATAWIVGGNPARTPIITRDTAQSALGSGFSGVQPGVGIWLHHPLTADWRIGIGTEVTFFEGLQRFRLRQIDIFLRYTQTVTSVALLLEYTPIRFPLARGYAFLGLEPRWNSISRGHYRYEQVERPTGRRVELLDTVIVKPPEPVHRFGIAARVGIGGELIEGWHFRASAGWAFLNALGRRDERGELLTPTRLGETRESPLFVVLTALSIQYHFRVP